MRERLRAGDEKQLEMAKRIRKFIEEEEEREARKAANDDTWCEECDGSGIHICECGHEHECQECEGTGEAPGQ